MAFDAASASSMDLGDLHAAALAAAARMDLRLHHDGLVAFAEQRPSRPCRPLRAWWPSRRRVRARRTSAGSLSPDTRESSFGLSRRAKNGTMRALPMLAQAQNERQFSSVDYRSRVCERLLPIALPIKTGGHTMPAYHNRPRIPYLFPIFPALAAFVGKKFSSNADASALICVQEYQCFAAETERGGMRVHRTCRFLS